MENEHQSDWDPRSEEARRDQRAAYDKMRQTCPVAHSDFLGWTLFRHRDVMRALLDHETFSNAVSQHLSVPNGMDPPEHTAYRRIIEPYFSEERMQAFQPVCRKVVQGILSAQPETGTVEVMSTLALPFAVRIQCAFLGWPESVNGTLIEWIRRSQEATLAQDRKALSAVALEFEKIIDDLLEARRDPDAGPRSDVTGALMNEKVWGRPLSNEEVASILRNWTAGEIGTISAAIGILLCYLAEHHTLQSKLRADPTLLSYSVDEILRLHGPLVANRRVTKRPVEVGGKRITEGERISLNWISANRDDEAFEDADTFRFDRDPSKNLLYGAGIHVCPGAPLARLELRVFLEEFLAKTREFILDKPSLKRALYPASGFASVSLRVR